MAEILQIAPLPLFAQEAPTPSFDVARYWCMDDPAAWMLANSDACRVVITHSGVGLSVDLLAQLPALELVANFGVGLDLLPLSALQERNIAISYTPDLLTDDVADLALGLVLATFRRIPEGDTFVRTGRWSASPIPAGRAIRGRNVGIMGLGRIGMAIAQRVEAFGCTLGYLNRSARDVPYQRFTDVAALARWADVVIVAVPGGPDTRGIVNGEVLAALGPDGVLINIARGDVVDELALIDALERGAIAAAGLDVFLHEPNINPRFATLANVVLTPHLGSATYETRHAMACSVHAEVERFLHGKPLLMRYE